MAGHVPRRLLKQPDIDKCLLAGTTLWKWEDGDSNLTKLLFRADPDGFFLYARGDDKGKCYNSFIWDFSLISDVRNGKPPKDSKLGPGGDDVIDLCLTLVYRREGIVNLDYINLIAESSAAADQFKQAVNALTANMLHAHAAPCRFLRKHCTRIRLHANGRGEISLKDLDRLMMIRYSHDNFINQWLGTFNVVKESVDGSSKFILEADLTEDIFLKMFDQILNNRVQDLDAVFSLMQGKSHKSKGQMTKDNFHKFLNADQRDPRLNEILHPYVTKEHASKLISRHEKGRRGDRLTSKGLLDYLLSDDNNVLDMDHLNQTHDMTAPLSHYFINSSHNTYLTGHQLRGKSTVEMYIQTLLMGCRCVELDCWPENDDICITHGATLCTKIWFKDVVEAINEFAFVTSEYPVILSIENHCKSKPKLIERMATIFKVTFGDKLLSEPFEDFPLEPGVPLPSPERLKRRIILKDKIKRGKSGGDFGTLPRSTPAVPPTLSEVPEETPAAADAATSEDPNRDTPTSNDSEVEVLPAITIKTESVPNNETDEEKKKEDKKDSKPSPLKLSSDAEASDEKKVTSEEEASPESGSSANEVNKSIEEAKPKLEEDFAPNTPTGTDSPRGSRLGGTHRPSLRSHGSMDSGDIDLAMVPRPSDVEGLGGASPLRELLNYCTGISFEGFLCAENLNCSFYMSSFADEKSSNYICQQPKEYVRYNIRQLSRVYPEGKRIASSNYMPQGHWDAGCQLVALNFQTPDLPMQLNNAKFEFNGNTGYILKPWALRSERAQFSPFVIKKLEDIVPAKISIKIISGYFLTDRRGANCFAEVSTYGLYADTIKNKFYTKRVPAPHPHWNENPFTFKQILLPELTLLRLVVYNDDHEIIGQRSLPLNAIRPGFRHIPLRDKHNAPLPLSMLFVHIKVEDWVPDDMGDFVLMLMDPIAYASAALQAMAAGTEEDPQEDGGRGGGRGGGRPSGIDTVPPIASAATPAGDSPPQAPSSASATPIRTPATNSGKKADPLGLGLLSQIPGSGSSQNLRQQQPAPPQLPAVPDDSIKCIEDAKVRDLPPITTHDDILVHKDYVKTSTKVNKDRQSLEKKQEKSLKSLQEKVGKGKATEENLSELKKQQQADMATFEKNGSTKLYEQKRKLMEAAHKVELEALKKKVHKKDFDDLNDVLLEMIREQRKVSTGEDRGDIKKKDSMKAAEDKLVQVGKKARNEFVMIHQREVSKMQDVQKSATQELIKAQAKVMAEFDAKFDIKQGSSTSRGGASL